MARTIQWLAAGASTPITLNRASGYRPQDATTGLTAPTYQLPTERYAGADGAEVTSVTADAREVVLALLVQGATRAEFRARVRTLVKAMRPKAGPGKLIVLDEDGNARTLTCYYAGGLEGNEARGTTRTDRWWKATIKLLAEDPWWYGEEFELPALLDAPPLFFPIFPLRFAPTNIDVRTDLDNVGDEDAFPVWTILGPGHGIELTNFTTGRSIALDTILGEGDTLVMDTRPGEQSVTLGTGANLFGDLLTDPAMWTLEPGVNDVGVRMLGASGTSRIFGRYQARYAGAL